MENAIAGGDSNVATCHDAVCGGRGNHAVGGATFIGGGYANVCTTGNYSAIAGGEGDTICGHHSAIPGGRKNIVNGDYSYAFGNEVIVSDNYTAAFFSETHPGKLKINDVLHLRPLDDLPPDVDSDPGDICVYDDAGIIKLYLFGYTGWVPVGP